MVIVTGLPRVVRTEADVAFLLSVVNSPANGTLFSFKNILFSGEKEEEELCYDDEDDVID